MTELEKKYASIAIQDRLDGGRSKLRKLIKSGNIGNPTIDNYKSLNRKSRRDLRLKLKAKARLGTITSKEKATLFMLSKDKNANQASNSLLAVSAATLGKASLGISALGAAGGIAGKVLARSKNKSQLKRLSNFVGKFENNEVEGFSRRERAKQKIDDSNKRFKLLRKAATHLRSNKSWAKR